MPNMRVIYENYADSGTTTASGGTISGVSNLKTDMKAQVCRGTGSTLTLTTVLPAAKTIRAIVLPFTTLTSTAKLRVAIYTASADASPAYDSGDTTNTSCFSISGLTPSVNTFAYGSSVYARHWIPAGVTGQKIVVTITDTSLSAIDIGRLIIGDYWEPSFGAEQDNTTMTLVDMTQQFRTDAGDQLLTVKPRYRKQTISMPSLDKTDRAKMWQILWNNGITKPVFISMYPNNTDVKQEQAYQIYGRLSTSPVMNKPYFNYEATKLDIEEL